jgi:ADP-heptose:LPS heptosyltransferase
MTTVLVLRALALGDLLVAVPALRALRRARPRDRIVLAAPAWAGELVGDAVDEVLPVTDPTQLPVRLHGGAPGVVVNLHGAGPQSHRALDALRPRTRIGFAGPPGWAGPDHAATRAAHPHERDLWCAMLTAHGIPAHPGDLRLRRPKRRPSATVVVHPGAAYGAKRWPADRFAAVARALDGPVPVVVTGSDGERAIAEEVAVGAGLPRERVLAGRTSLPQLCALVAGAQLVVCGDTGVAHVASAYGTPSVVLFGPVGPQQWGPPLDGPHTVLDRPALRRGAPFTDDPDPALLAIDVADVVAAAWSRLDQWGSRTR